MKVQPPLGYQFAKARTGLGQKVHLVPRSGRAAVCGGIQRCEEVFDKAELPVQVCHRCTHLVEVVR